ncbi:MAG: hypothetical protein NZM12_01435 [Steroidobacteraceae bacterium]|nr:hypothetical protein [Steroidobacteraceae bacterium]MDW8260851.1 hypothetical protein [Gammaproteobacteria bacterium]
MLAQQEKRGQPYVLVEPKRSFDEVLCEVDWHDYLARLRLPGTQYLIGTAIRLIRDQATGLEYLCSTSGVTSRTPTAEIRWPRTAGQTLTDGSVVWTAQAVSISSLRTTITSNAWSATSGVNLGAEFVSDLRYQVIVAGGVSGQHYEVRHRVTLANGEDKEAVILLPVQD